MFLIFDTETTGFPLKDLADPKNPRIMQLAWSLVNSEGKPFKTFESLILPEGWEMPSVELYLREGKDQKEAEKRAKFWVDNGYTQEQNLKEGMPIKKALDQFMIALSECKYLIAHNIEYDIKMITIEFLKLGFVLPEGITQIDTMKPTTDLVKAPGQYGGYKWPSLTELHTFLFNKGFDGAHDALADVKACANCFFKLKKGGFYDNIMPPSKFVSTTHDKPWLNADTETFLLICENLKNKRINLIEVEANYQLSSSLKIKLQTIQYESDLEKK